MQGRKKDFQDSTWASLAPLLLSLPLFSYSILIQSILCSDCSGEKDVAEASKRIITTGSKQSCKSIPSGHGGCCMKQRQDRQCYVLEGKGRKEEIKEKWRREERKKGSGNAELCISWKGSSPAHAAVWLMSCFSFPASLWVSLTL